jgi:stearoyl-CoA desaturase (delta-9 desaturase)
MAKSRIEKTLVIVTVIVPIIGTLIAIWQLWQRYVGWTDVALLVTLYVLTGFGITIGFHRMLTHRSFEAHPVVRFILLALGSMTFQGSPLQWASIHIKHHAETDTEEDPHSPMEGFFHAHIGWLVTGPKADLEVYGKWLLKDPVVVFMSKTWFIWAGLGLIIPFAIGGWTGFVWGALVRIFLLNHVTWSVNSVCHTFGKRMFETTDMSKNNWLVGLLAMGEGWHNNHHAFPRSAFHGMRWYQFDASSYVIRLMERLGLVWNVYRVPAPSLAARLISPNGTQTNIAAPVIADPVVEQQ